MDTPIPLKKVDRNSRIFAIIWILLEAFFCVMYGVYGHTSSADIYNSGGVFAYVSAVGIALASVIGLGGIMSYVSGLKWSGFGFAFLILAMAYQYYFLINAFWTKAGVQNTKQSPTGTIVAGQKYGEDFIMYVSEMGASLAGTAWKTLGLTATGAFKMAMTITIGFASVMGRAGPLEIMFFVLIGGALYELNRQIISNHMYDVGGSDTIFMFGGLMGTVVSFVLTLFKQKEDVVTRKEYTASRYNITLAFVGAAFFWVFFPLIFLDLPLQARSSLTNSSNPFMPNNAMINAYYAISSCVVTCLALSAVVHGRIRFKDLMYAPFAGAAIIASSAVHIFNPIAAILLGMVAGLIQPLFNLL